MSPVSTPNQTESTRISCALKSLCSSCIGLSVGSSVRLCEPSVPRIRPIIPEPRCGWNKLRSNDGGDGRIFHTTRLDSPGTEVAEARSYIQTPTYNQYNYRKVEPTKNAIVCHPTFEHGAHSRTATDPETTTGCNQLDRGLWKGNSQISPMRL